MNMQPKLITPQTSDGEVERMFDTYIGWLRGFPGFNHEDYGELVATNQLFKEPNYEYARYSIQRKLNGSAPTPAQTLFIWMSGNYGDDGEFAILHGVFHGSVEKGNQYWWLDVLFQEMEGNWLLIWDRDGGFHRDSN